MAEQRYTLTLPEELYEEMRTLADKNGASIKEVVRQCLKFGLVALKISEDQNKELYFKETLQDSTGDIDQVKETRLHFVL